MGLFNVFNQSKKSKPSDLKLREQIKKKLQNYQPTEGRADFTVPHKVVGGLVVDELSVNDYLIDFYQNQDPDFKHKP